MNVTCRVCGGTDYTIEGGFYYCNECHTQTQELREEVYDCGDRTYLTANKITIRQTENDKKEKVKSWTTWEGYNVILEGLADELICVGAPSELKFVTFQLWTAYLSAIKVAFFSLKNDQLPNLSAAFRIHDAQIIYNFAKTTKKSSKSRSKSNISEISSISQSTPLRDKRAFVRQRARNKRALIQADYEASKINENLEKSFSEYSTTSISGSSMSTNSKRLKLNAKARKEKLRKFSRNHLKKHCMDNLPCHKFTTTKVSGSYLLSPYHLSLSKLYAILYLALLQCKTDIYIGDLIRYIHEGHLSFVDFKHLFPEDMAMDKNFQQLFEIQHKLFTNSSLRSLAAQISKLIGIKHIPCPNIEKLCQRYVTELQLPDQIMNLIKHLLEIDPPKVVYEKKLRFIPNYEGRAMAYIVFALKILLGLNDSTEHDVSRLAKKLNKHYTENLSPLKNTFRKYFIWNEWVEFIECRKIFVAEYHFPSRIKYFPYHDHATDLFSNYWQKQKLKNVYYEENASNLKLFVYKKIFEKLKMKSSDGNNDFITEFSPNCTPLYSICIKLNEILNHDQIPTLLTQNYTNLNIDFLLQPYAFIQKHNLNAEVIKTEKENQIIPSLINFTANSKKLDTTNIELKNIKNEKFIERKEKTSESQIDINKLIAEALNSIQNKNENNDLLKFFDGSASYWIEPSMLIKEFTSGYFEQVEKILPESFQWLLKECSQVCELSAKELYRELIIVEMYLGIISCDNIKKKYCEHNSKNQSFKKMLRKVQREW